MCRRWIVRILYNTAAEKAREKCVYREKCIFERIIGRILLHFNEFGGIIYMGNFVLRFPVQNRWSRMQTVNIHKYVPEI